MEKPTIEQTAWVLKHLTKHLMEGGSYRYLIYDRMGYTSEAYLPLYEAGGLAISNALYIVNKEADDIENVHKDIDGIMPLLKDDNARKKLELCARMNMLTRLCDQVLKEIEDVE